MAVDLISLKPGDVLDFWHDTVAFGYSIHYARVVKVGAKQVRVRYEGSDREVWRSPHRFDIKVPEQEVASLRADGVAI